MRILETKLRVGNKALGIDHNSKLTDPFHVLRTLDVCGGCDVASEVVPLEEPMWEGSAG